MCLALGGAQCIMAPTFVPLFTAMLYCLEGRPQEIIPSLKEIYVEVMLTNYKLWIPMQLLNFGLIPVQYQVLMSNITALVWNTYLSYINRAENRATETN